MRPRLGIGILHTNIATCQTSTNIWQNTIIEHYLILCCASMAIVLMYELIYNKYYLLIRTVAAEYESMIAKELGAEPNMRRYLKKTAV
jgi:hypothetical protein